MDNYSTVRIIEVIGWISKQASKQAEAAKVKTQTQSSKGRRWENVVGRRESRVVSLKATSRFAAVKSIEKFVSIVIT